MTETRSRAWRRHQAAKHRRAARHAPNPPWAHEQKQWTLLWARWQKLHRARQIGMLWPRREWEKAMAEAEPVRVLFVCSFNQWRSPTAERVFARVDGVEPRSAGTSSKAKRRVRLDDIRWADVICVMEDKHAQRLRADFRQDMAHKDLHVLDIPDDYQFMDEELVELIREKVTAVLAR